MITTKAAKRDTILLLNFDSKLTLTPTRSNLYLSFSNTSMSDSVGRFLYYSNGCKVYNAKNQLLRNGDGINFGFLRDELCRDKDYGTYNGHQSIVSMKDSYRDSLYYMYHVQYDVYDSVKDGRLLFGNVLRTTININRDNGKGEVIEKNKVILKDTLANDQITAVRHANNKDWWIVVRQGRKEYWDPLIDSTNVLYKILVTKDSNIIFKQNIGDSIPMQLGGNSKFTNDGKKYINYVPDRGLYIYDFDRNTGLFSNPQKINVPYLEPTLFYVGVLSSPNSRFVYCIQYQTILQYDLQAPDIKASEVIVAKYDGVKYNGYETFFNLGQMGPDCKLYISSADAIPYYHFIRYPDRKGTACEVVQRGLSLGDKYWNTWSLIPYYPNYRQHLSYPCDSNIVISGTEAPNPVWEQTLVYPNPASDYITLRGHLEFKHGQFVLYNAIGKEVLTQELRAQEQEYTIPIRTLPVGLYFYHIQDDIGAYRSSGKVEVVR